MAVKACLKTLEKWKVQNETPKNGMAKEDKFYQQDR